jgi:hypothetical protein
MNTYETASPIADKHLEPDGSMRTSAGASVAPANAEWAARYIQASPIADKWLNPDGTITAGNAGGGGSEPVYPASGIAVSTGSGWGTSIATANVPLLNAANNIFTGQLTVGTGNTASIAVSNGFDSQFSFYRLAFVSTQGTRLMFVLSDYTTGAIFYVPVALAADPTTAMQAATKQYVDNTRPQIIQAADEATAISDSTANPNNFYFWV